MLATEKAKKNNGVDHTKENYLDLLVLRGARQDAAIDDVEREIEELLKLSRGSLFRRFLTALFPSLSSAK